MEERAAAGQEVDEEWKQPTITCGEANDEVGDTQQPDQLLPQAEYGPPLEIERVVADAGPVGAHLITHDRPRLQHSGQAFGEGELQVSCKEPS